MTSSLGIVILSFLISFSPPTIIINGIINIIITNIRLFSTPTLYIIGVVKLIIIRPIDIIMPIVNSTSFILTSPFKFFVINSAINERIPEAIKNNKDVQYLLNTISL